MIKQDLRPYQAKAIAEAREAYRAGKRAILFVAPTGAGKTRIGVELVRSAIERGGSVVWLAHREELLAQARDRLLAEGLPRVGIIAAGEPTMNAPVQVCMIQTLAARAARGLPPASAVIFDEAHHYAASEWGAVAAHYQDRLRFGLTATPERGDGRAMGDLFDHVISVSSVRELQALGVLVPCITYAPSTRTKTLSQDPVAAYKSRCMGERAFVFVKNVAQGERLTQDFIANQVHAALITGGTPWLLRRARIEAFRTQSSAPLLAAGSCEQVPLVLVNAYVLTEGVDVPEASCCILARGCGHPGTMLQMVGRVLRAAPGKTRATLIDLCGVVHKLGLPEADRVWSLDGKAIALTEEEREVSLKPCPKCGGMVGAWTTDAEGWRCCPFCAARVLEPQVATVVTRELHAMGTAAPPEERARFLHKVATTAATKGFKPGWAAVKYKERFGDWPPRGDGARAFALAVDRLGAEAVQAARDAREVARAERAAREALALEAAKTDAEQVGGDIDDEQARANWKRYLDEQARAG